MATTATPDGALDVSDLVTVDQAAEMLGVNHNTIRRRIADGSLPGYRFGPRLLRVKRSDVANLGRLVPTVGAL